MAGSSEYNTIPSSKLYFLPKLTPQKPLVKPSVWGDLVNMANFEAIGKRVPFAGPVLIFTGLSSESGSGDLHGGALQDRRKDLYS